jgi:hypothetical protein
MIFENECAGLKVFGRGFLRGRGGVGGPGGGGRGCIVRTVHINLEVYNQPLAFVAVRLGKLECFARAVESRGELAALSKVG